LKKSTSKAKLPNKVDGKPDHTPVEKLAAEKPLD